MTKGTTNLLSLLICLFSFFVLSMGFPFPFMYNKCLVFKEGKEDLGANVTSSYELKCMRVSNGLENLSYCRLFSCPQWQDYENECQTRHIKVSNDSYCVTCDGVCIYEGEWHTIGQTFDNSQRQRCLCNPSGIVTCTAGWLRSANGLVMNVTYKEFCT